MIVWGVVLGDTNRKNRFAEYASVHKARCKVATRLIMLQNHLLHFVTALVVFIFYEED